MFQKFDDITFTPTNFIVSLNEFTKRGPGALVIEDYFDGDIPYLTFAYYDYCTIDVGGVKRYELDYRGKKEIKPTSTLTCLDVRIRLVHSTYVFD